MCSLHLTNTLLICLMLLSAMPYLSTLSDRVRSRVRRKRREKLRAKQLKRKLTLTGERK